MTLPNFDLGGFENSCKKTIGRKKQKDKIVDLFSSVLQNQTLQAPLSILRPYPTPQEHLVIQSVIQIEKMELFEKNFRYDDTLQISGENLVKTQI